MVLVLFETISLWFHAGSGLSGIFIKRNLSSSPALKTVMTYVLGRIFFCRRSPWSQLNFGESKNECGGWGTCQIGSLVGNRLFPHLESSPWLLGDDAHLVAVVTNSIGTLHTQNLEGGSADTSDTIHDTPHNSPLLLVFGPSSPFRVLCNPHFRHIDWSTVVLNVRYLQNCSTVI